MRVATVLVLSFLVFATSAMAMDPQRTQRAIEHVQANAAELGFESGDLDDLVVSDVTDSSHSGAQHVYLQQRLDGIAVVNGIINVSLDRDGNVIHMGNRFIAGLAQRVNTRAPQLDADSAVVAAAADLGISVGRPTLAEELGGPSQSAVYESFEVSYDPIPVELMYLEHEGEVHLVWSLVIRQVGKADWWNSFVDARNGTVLTKFNWTVHDNFGFVERSEDAPRRESSARLSTARATAEGIVQDAGSRQIEGDCTDNCYTALELPKDSPYDGPLTVIDNPADATASPFGWHDTNGSPGAEFTDTRGNNVNAQTDLDDNNFFTPGTDIRVDGGANLIFDEVFDPLLEPADYREAAVVNLFYYNNIMHDVTYQYGFDESSGNFQTNNYGNGGNGNDEVEADAQDGSGTNNANFGTPPDGGSGRMQMYVWLNPFSQQVTVNSPFSAEWPANPSNNGGLANGITADIELVVDTTPPTDDACEAVTNNLTGKIALIQWNQGACNSSVFVANAANAGAVAAIIIDNTDDPFTNFGGSAAIPSVAIGVDEGQQLRDAATTPNVTIDDNADPTLVDRDSDLDNGIIAHEYGHGISNRLVGGPSQAGCLGNTEQMGEGWSDWWTVALTALPSHTPETPRGVGNYSSFRAPGAEGIRNFPYSTDMTVNPETYADVDSVSVPHGVGSIWNSALWEMHWALVLKNGFNEDFYAPWNTGGNNLAIQLVVDGLKMTSCNPGFVDGRDGILAADVALTGGANQCEIWNAFAKRGVGFSADQGSVNAVGDETVAFDLPPGIPMACNPELDFNSGFEQPE